ncbi:predicted protein [Naegleria gruberi]|uniref:Predicted protein n=1 Tax=Naegleria gruberi TaxID=5762 RepID=D2W633_NAEGR|nr:uncharacterized protein NAEGRDRAFT_76876 [Naegleria gruberi]EFC35467.1 predicted protein [Naegleria gruberi]|eukprot:XP_002668211.1 predicted protein [Naegleria gruberi strain NEG-M]
MFAVGHGLKALLMKFSMGHQMATIITHPIMVGIHRVGCDLSNTREWKEELGKVITLNGMFGGLFRGIIPQLIANYLVNIVNRSNVFNGLVIPGISYYPFLGEIFPFVKRVMIGVAAGLVSYPFTTLSLRMQMNPEVAMGDIISEMTNEGISGIYAGFATHLVANILTAVLHKFLDLVIRKPLKTQRYY